MDKLPDVAGSRGLSQSSETPSSAWKQKEILTAAKNLLGCYRTGDANDPEIYITAAVRVMSQYPLDVVQRVVDPITGLPGKINWLPTVKEIRDACQEIYGPTQRLNEWKDKAAQQLAEREKLDTERARRPTLAELHTKYDGPNGEPWGLDVGRRRPMSRDEARGKLASRFGQAALDGAPDSPAADYHTTDLP